MNHGAGGPPVIVERGVCETSSHGHSSTILTTPLYRDGDEVAIQERLERLASTVVLPVSKTSVLIQPKARRQLADCVRRANIVHVAVGLQEKSRPVVEDAFGSPILKGRR